MRSVVESLVPVEVLSFHDGPVKAIRFSPDGRYLATADAGMRLCLVAEGQVRHRLDLQGRHSRGRAVDRMRDVAFSPEGESLYVAAGRYVWALDVESGTAKWRYQAPNFLSFLVNSPTTVAVSVLGEVLVAFEDGLMERFEPGGRKVRRRRDNDAPVHMDYLSDGRTLVGCDPFTLTVWAEFGQRKTWNTRPNGHVHGFALCPNSNRVALRALETVEVYDVAAGALLAEYSIGTGLPLIAWHPTCDRLATADVEGVTLRSLSGAPLAEARTPGVRVTAVAFDPTGTRLLVGGRDGSIRVFAC